MIYNKFIFLCILINFIFIINADNNICDNCINLINILRGSVDNNSTIIDIIHFINYVCSHIYAPGSKECSLIVKNIELIISLIHNNTNSTIICTDLHLCKLI